MAKRNRASRAKNKIKGLPEGALIKVDPEPLTAAPAEIYRSSAVTLVRSPLFSVEFEKVIEIIARERVYRAMLAGLGRPLLLGPRHPPDPP